VQVVGAGITSATAFFQRRDTVFGNCKRGFTVIEILVTAAVACMFASSVISAVISFGYGGKLIADGESRMVLLEKKILLRDTLNVMSSRNLPKICQTKGIGIKDKNVKVGFYSFPSANADFFRRIYPEGNEANHVAITPFRGDAWISFAPVFAGAIVDLKNKAGAKTPSIDIKLWKNKGMYLKPVYAASHNNETLKKLKLEKAKDVDGPKGDVETWDKGALLELTEKNFENLLNLAKDGKISRIYFVIRE
jgi:prepilin-type N-terminal cleavage/methylation domain-containing protein